MSTETTIPPVTTVTRSNRGATIAVCATDQGLPVEIRVDRQELRYGAAALADEIMRLCRQATLEAGALRREELAEAGIATDVLDRLGLPTRDQVVTQETHFEERETAPTSWLRPV